MNPNEWSGEDSSPLASGTEVGSYRIEGVVGAGGMGVVYRAVDTRLKRPVALKVLAEDLSGTAARARFQREAQAASALNHPHIVTVHDVGEFEGRQYLVTEFVDGGTLRQWSRSQPRSWRETVELLVGIADGLAAAHAAGILHRDIKPDNILVARNGYAKLADFGLAKLHEPSPSDATKTKTLHAGDRTAAGVVVGTIAYMSPEQASGKPIDFRSDIFSFGVVLYEALTGARPFTGATEREVMYAIVQDAPAPLPQDLPVPLRMAVEKAIEKDPAERYQSASELVVDLRRVLRQTGEATATKVRPAVRSSRGRLVAGAAAGAVFIAAAWYFAFHTSPTAPASSQWTQITDYGDSAVSPAVSADGRVLTFLRGANTFIGPADVYAKLLPDGEPAQLTHDHSDKLSPAVAPDDSRIAYTVNEDRGWNTYVVPLLGGEPRRLLPNAEGLQWIGPKSVLFSEIKKAPHMAIVTGGEDRSNERDVFLPAHERGMGHRSYLSPDGKSVLVVEMGEDGEWLPCRMVPFDGSSPGSRVGPQDGGCTHAAWSPRGDWMYLNSNAGGSGYHVWRQRARGGDPEQITFGPTEQEGIAMMPDGRSVISSAGTVQKSIWLHTTEGERQITSEESTSSPVFSHDGSALFYTTKTSQFVPSGELWRIELAGGGRQQVVAGYKVSTYDVSPDDKLVAFTSPDGTGHSRMWIASVDHRKATRQVPGENIITPRFAPNGDLAFVVAEGKQSYLYGSRVDGSGRKKLIEMPVLEFYGFSPDGQWALVWANGAGNGPESRPFFTAYRLAGGELVPLCTPCVGLWPVEGKAIYLATPREVFRVPLSSSGELPQLPRDGVRSEADLKSIPGATVFIPAGVGLTFERGANVAVKDRSTYAYVRTIVHRNLYRIPLP